MAKDGTTLNPKQQRFVDEYCIDLNGKQAAIRAGYSKNSAEVQASQLLSLPKVAAVVKARLAASTQKAILTVERLDQEIARLAFADIRKFYDESGNLKAIGDLDDDAAAGVASVEALEEYDGSGGERVLIGHVKKLKLWDKGGAMMLAARRLGALQDKMEHSGTVTLESLVGASFDKPKGGA